MLYGIVNRVSGAFLGVFDADTADGAVDAMNRAAGYATRGDMPCDAPDGELGVRPIALYDYRTSERLSGALSADLAQASMTETSGTGAVRAHVVDGVWESADSWVKAFTTVYAQYV